jgi:hypothetical protein
MLMVQSAQNFARNDTPAVLNSAAVGVNLSKARCVRATL